MQTANLARVQAGLRKAKRTQGSWPVGVLTGLYFRCPKGGIFAEKIPERLHVRNIHPATAKQAAENPRVLSARLRAVLERQVHFACLFFFLVLREGFRRLHRHYPTSNDPSRLAGAVPLRGGSEQQLRHQLPKSQAPPYIDSPNPPRCFRI